LDKKKQNLAPVYLHYIVRYVLPVKIEIDRFCFILTTIKQLDQISLVAIFLL
jgi:hypothetical protein